MYEKKIHSESSFNEKYEMLLKEVSSHAKNELLAMVGARYYCALIKGNDSSEILPALVEYLQLMKKTMMMQLVKNFFREK